MNGMPLRARRCSARLSHTVIRPTLNRELRAPQRLLATARAVMTLSGAQGTFARLRLPPACGALRCLACCGLLQWPQWPPCVAILPAHSAAERGTVDACGHSGQCVRSPVDARCSPCRPVCLSDELAGDARAALEVALRKERCVAAPL
jgi:hypothetical protein